MLSPTDRRKLLAALLTRQQETEAEAQLPPERIAEIAAGSPPSDNEAAALLASPAARKKLAVYHRRRPRPPVPTEIDWMSWTPFHTRLLLTLAASWASVGLQVALIVIFKGTMVGSLDAGNMGMGITLSLSLLATAVGALVFGRLADQFGRRFVFSVSIALCALGSALTALSSSIAMLEVSRLIAGIGIGGGYVTVNATIQEFMPARERGRTCLAVNGSFWLGAVFSALGAVWLFGDFARDVALDSWRIAFWISSALSVLMLLLLRSVPESPRWLVAQGHIYKAERIVKNMLPRGTTAPRIAEPVLFDTRLGTPTLRKVAKIMYHDHWHTLLLCFALMSVQAFFYNASFFGYVDVLVNKMAAEPTQIGWHLLFIALGNFLGPIFLGWLLVDRRHGRRWTMAIAFLAAGMLLAVTAVLFAPSGEGGPLGFGSREFTLAWTAIFFFASTAASTAYLTSGELFPLEIRGLAFAIVFAASMLVGGVLGPWLFAISEGSRLAVADLYLFAAVLMIAVGIAVAPEVLPEVLPRPLARIWSSWRIPASLLPERSRERLETVRPRSAS
jgi:MFS family permease